MVQREFDDATLYREVRDFDDQQAFKELFFRYFNPLSSFLRLFLNDATQRDDVVQEVFCQLWEKRKVLDITTSVKAYLFTSIKNRAFNHLKTENLKSKVKNQFFQDLVLVDHATPEKLLVNQEVAQKISSLIQNLPEKAKEVYRLRYVENLKQKEIAYQLEISENTVEKHLSYIRNYFKSNYSVEIN
jgi:RNA polymerase sigma-70 factor, ECF subfamily